MPSANTKGRKGRPPRAWSYSAGEWGVNRVRAYDRGAKGIYLDFLEAPDERTGERRRARIALGHGDRKLAKAKADEIAAAFRKEEHPVGRLTLRRLFDNYLAEVSKDKSVGKRKHDEACAEMFCRFFGATRKPHTLSRRDWERFISDRRAGRIAPKGVEEPTTVGERVIAYDLKFLRAVLRWATMAGDGRGGTLLDRNPLDGLPYPKNESPRRPALTAEEYEGVRAVASRVHPFFALAIILAHETGHRLASIRHLRWSDVDLELRRIRWRAENDKVEFEHVTPLTDVAVAALAQAKRERPAIGDAWILPRLRDASRPACRSTLAKWWRRAETLAELPRVPGRGYHAFRRTFASELRHVPLKDLCDMGGWKSAQTVLTCYITPDEAAQRRALEGRRTLRRAGIS